MPAVAGAAVLAAALFYAVAVWSSAHAARPSSRLWALIWMLAAIAAGSVPACAARITIPHSTRARIAILAGLAAVTPGVMRTFSEPSIDPLMRISALACGVFGAYLPFAKTNRN